MKLIGLPSTELLHLLFQYDTLNTCELDLGPFDPGITSCDGRRRGVENRLIPLTWPIAYTVACRLLRTSRDVGFFSIYHFTLNTLGQTIHDYEGKFLLVEKFATICSYTTVVFVIHYILESSLSVLLLFLLSLL